MVPRNIYKDQKGIALIAAIGISLMLMLVAVAVAYRVGLFTERTSLFEKKDQLTFTADLGLEELRYYFWERGCVPPAWCGIGNSGVNSYIDFINYVQNNNNINQKFPNVFLQDNDTIGDNTTTVATVSHQIDSQNSVGRLTINWNILNNRTDQYEYSIYTKPGNTPDILYVMVASKKVQNAGTQEQQVVERTTVEAALFYSGEEEYAQEGQGKARTGTAEVSVTQTTTSQL